MSSRPRIGSVNHVPHLRQQRSIASIWPTSAAGYHATPATERPGRYLPGQLGRFPTVGLDPGASPGTRPDQSRITQR